MSFNITFSGLPELEAALNRLNSVRFDAIVKKQATEILNRARAGGTPVDTGELRNSSGADLNAGEVGYTAEYAPHVEYGHRTRGGGSVAGQRYLQKNVETQQPIYIQDLIDAIKKEGG